MTNQQIKKRLDGCSYDVVSAKRKKLLKQGVAFILAVIPLIGFFIFSIAPLLLSFISLFCDVNLRDLGDIRWNNFEGFKLVFVKDYANDICGIPIQKYFVKSFGITLWIASTQLITLVIAMVISVLLAQKPKGAKIFQILFFIPYICSTVAVTYMFGQIFSSDSSGILNTLFGETINWQDEKHLTWTIIIAIIWSAPGYGIVMYKAALGNINTSLYEAAELDGMNGFQKFFKVTFPSIAPTTYYLLICGVSAGLLTFDICKLMAYDWTSPVGGKDQMGLTLMWLVYYLVDNADRATFSEVSMLSSASIISWIMFIITAGINLFLFNRRQKSME